MESNKDYFTYENFKVTHSNNRWLAKIELGNSIVTLKGNSEEDIISKIEDYWDVFNDF